MTQSTALVVQSTALVVLEKVAVNAIADALSVETRKLEAANKKRAASLALLARKSSVAQFISDASVSVAIVTDLYLTEKVLKCADALSSDHTIAADFNDNTFAALKTVLLNAEREVFESDLLKASISNNFKLSSDQSAFCYRRANLISATRQENLNVKFLEVLNIVTRVSKTQVKVNKEAHAFKAIQKVAQMSL
jgi:hypothetical protein